MDEVGPPLLQEAVILQVLWVHSIELRSSQHANVEVGVTCRNSIYHCMCI